MVYFNAVNEDFRLRMFKAQNPQAGQLTSGLRIKLRPPEHAAGKHLDSVSHV